MHICFKTLGICLTESDSDQTGTGLLRRTSKDLTNLSPLRPLRGAILVEKVVVVIVDEDAPGNVVRAPRVTRFATSSGMGSVTKVGTAHSSMSRNPSRDQVPRKTEKVGGRRAVHHPRIESQRKKWPRSLAHTSNREIAGGGTCFYKHEKTAAPTKEPKRTNSPAPKKKPTAKAAPCIAQRYACIAKGKRLPKATKAMKDQCYRAVVFSSKVEYYKVPATGEQRKVVYRPRVYEKSYPRTDMVPKTDPLVVHRAQVIARQLQETVKLFGKHPQPACRFLCTDEDGSVTCNLCRSCIGPKSKVTNTHLPTVATPAPKDKCVWLVDTGSEQDLISEGMLKTANATNRRVSDTPICLAKANCSTRADEVADVTVDALHKDFAPYILDETPPVLSVGVRCMEQG